MTRSRKQIIKANKENFVIDFKLFIEKEDINLDQYASMITPCFKDYTLETLIETDPLYMFSSVIDYEPNQFNYWYPIHLKWMNHLTTKYGLTH